MLRSTPMTAVEFGLRVSRSPQYIRKLIKQGKITENSLVSKGKQRLIVPELALADMAKNISAENKQELVFDESKHLELPVAKKEPTRPPGGMVLPDDVSHADMLAIIDNANVMEMTLAEAQTVHERFKAALKKLEYEKKEGELLPAAEVKALWSQSVSAARSKILSLKGKLGPLLKEFIDDQTNFNVLMDAVEQVEFEVLKDLERGEL